MADHMTAKMLQALERKPPPAVRQEIADAHLPGLYLIRQPSGSMSWAIRYRFDGKPRKATLGTYPAIGLADARKAAGAALRAVGEGRDPGAEKVAEKAARRLPRPAEDRDLVRVVVADFLKRAVAGKNRSAALTEAIFRNHVTPAWGERKVQSITRRDVLDLTDGLVDKGQPYAANRAFAAVRRLFNWCVERGVVDTSPCAGLKPPGAEQARDRVLTDTEIKLFWKATAEIGQPFGPLFRLLLLTGQRREEVAGMRFAEIEGEDWTIPPERAKNGRAHLVPLSAEALDAVMSVQRIAGRAGFVFTTTGASSVSGYSKAKARLDAAMLKLAREDDAEAEIEPWRLHDLRRTTATGLARLRIPPHVIEAVLNHQSGQISGIARVYNRHQHQDEKRAALAAWGRFVADLVADKPADNVITLGRR